MEACFGMCVAILNKILYYNTTTYTPNTLFRGFLAHKTCLFVTPLFSLLLRVCLFFNYLWFSGVGVSCSIRNEWFRMVGEFT